jgi:N-acyl-L-homoserine lactone synthetase
MWNSQHSDAESHLAATPRSAFARNIFNLLEQVEYRRCENGEDLEAVFRLRYKCFHSHGLLDPSEAQTLTDSIDRAPNCYIFGVFMDDKLVSTVRIHHLTKETPYAPTMSVYGDLLEPRLAAGESFIDPSRLAVDPDVSAWSRVLPHITLRPAVFGNTYFKSTSTISMIREEHSGFYRRFFRSRQVTAPRIYPPFTMPIYFYESRCDWNLQWIYDNFPFFSATPLEQRMAFCRPHAGDAPTLTVLPSARYAGHAA